MSGAGEIVTFDKTGNLKSEFMPVGVKKAHCIFEYIYFARLDSKIDNISVYEARIRGGVSGKYSLITRPFCLI